MTEEQLHLIIAMWTRVVLAFCCAIVIVCCLIMVSVAHASPAAPKDGVCEVLVIEDGQTTVFEVGPCNSIDS